MNIVNFKTFIGILNGGIYIPVLPDDASEMIIRKIAEDVGIYDIHDELHVTVAAQPKYKGPNLPIVNSTTIYDASVVGFDLFGEDKNILVLKLESSSLQKRHQEFLDFGIPFDFSPYTPHVTLSYDYSGELPELGKWVNTTLSFSGESLRAFED